MTTVIRIEIILASKLGLSFGKAAGIAHPGSAKKLVAEPKGCNNGNCGACTVMMDGVPVLACCVLAVEAEGAEIETIEAIAEQGHLHPIQQCFLEGAALQCGICTPGFIVAAKALLEKKPNATEKEIRFDLSNNLCRCTGYDKIVRSVMDAAAKMRGGAG